MIISNFISHKSLNTLKAWMHWKWNTMQMNEWIKICFKTQIFYSITYKWLKPMLYEWSHGTFQKLRQKIDLYYLFIYFIRYIIIRLIWYDFFSNIKILH